MTLCDACKQKSEAWLDYRLPRSVKIASGASRDDTTAGVSDAQRGRFDKWRKTISEQHDLIQRICEKNHQVSTDVYSIDLTREKGACSVGTPDQKGVISNDPIANIISGDVGGAHHEGADTSRNPQVSPTIISSDSQATNPDSIRVGGA
ncbi:hypothetical protein FZI93_15120 [Mycobacterium sp. CBMA361]|nr:hypothetical protein [Mycolicibacterium sp. CBMA 213]MUM33013.1 hypothetical protein [Mycolicibacterium sp. CBMA 361]